MCQSRYVHDTELPIVPRVPGAKHYPGVVVWLPGVMTSAFHIGYEVPDQVVH